MGPLESMALPTVDVSRCGEIFVTNNADKWTFFCSYCQKSTNDIGVFICHIRLDHLSNLECFQPQKINLQTSEESYHVSNMQDGSYFPRQDKQETESHLIKEETLSQYSETISCKASKVVDISSLTDSNETESAFSDKNGNQTYIPPDETNEEFLDILPKGADSQQQEFTTIEENIETIQVVYRNDDEVIDIDDIDDDDIEEILDSDVSNENNEDGNEACGSMYTEKNETTDSLMHECQYCLRSFKSERGLHFHNTQVHNEKYHKQSKYKCKLCKKGFKTGQGLKDHIKAHDKKNVLQCPLCPAKQFKISFFLQHVMKHESDKCFPCQTCGNVYGSNKERLTHWQTHDKDKPYACDSCYRRFRRKHFLIHHLKKHGQYNCFFCPQQFVTNKTLRPPYVCPNCEKLPDIKQKVEFQKSLTLKHQNHVYESDEE